jgi:hypothetical protein
MLWPPSGTYDYELAGFRAFRNFDGAGSNFGDTSVSTTLQQPRRRDGLHQHGQHNARPGCDGGHQSRKHEPGGSDQRAQPLGHGQFVSNHGNHSFGAKPDGDPVTPVSIGTMAVSGSSLTLTLPAYSVTTIDVP